MKKIAIIIVSLILALVAGLAGCTAQPLTVTHTVERTTIITQPAETVTKTVTKTVEVTKTVQMVPTTVTPPTITVTLPSPTLTSPPNQTIGITMSPGSVITSSVSYTKRLGAGENVRGFVRLTGKYSSVDWDHTCCFKVFDPKTNLVYKWCGEFKEGGFYHEFSFVASYEGEYRLQVEQWSNYFRSLHIEVYPPGWIKINN